MVVVGQAVQCKTICAVRGVVAQFDAVAESTPSGSSRSAHCTSPPPRSSMPFLMYGVYSLSSSLGASAGHWIWPKEALDQKPSRVLASDFTITPVAPGSDDAAVGSTEAGPMRR